MHLSTLIVEVVEVKSLFKIPININMIITKHPFDFALHIWVRQHMEVKLLQWRFLATHQLKEAGIQGFDTWTSVCNQPSDKVAYLHWSNVAWS